MAGSRLGFDRNHIELHQVFGVKLQPHAVGVGVPSGGGVDDGQERENSTPGTARRTSGHCS
jgi:hypothetical protein